MILERLEEVEISKIMAGKPIVGAGIVPNVEHQIANDIIKSYISKLENHSAGFKHTTIVESKSDTFTAVTRFEELLNAYSDIKCFLLHRSRNCPCSCNCITRKRAYSG